MSVTAVVNADRGTGFELEAAPTTNTLGMEAFNSQDFVEYLNEFRFASLEAADHVEDHVEEAAEDAVEEGEEELEWLRRTGYDFLLCADEPSQDNPDVEWEALQTLSHRQAAVVKRRVQTLRDTLRRKRTRDKGRKLDVRHVFAGQSPTSGEHQQHQQQSCGSNSVETRSRSATPDSLDSLSPPHTPPDGHSRLAAGSPHSQGYHSSSRGSLDQLEVSHDDQQKRPSEYRHVLRISLDQPPYKFVSAEPLQPPAGPARQLRLKPAAEHGDVTDRNWPRDNSGRYSLSQFTAPRITPPAEGIEAVPFHPLRSIRLSVDQKVSACLNGPMHIPRVKAAAGPDINFKGSVEPMVWRGSAEERLGRTRVDHLSEADATRVQKLALLELTGLLDEHGISYSRRKARRKHLRARTSGAGDTQVFGTLLSSLLERDGRLLGDAGPPPVPLLFERVLQQLERCGVREEGLLRIPGHSQKIESLKQLIDDKFYTQPALVEAALSRSSPNDTAALLKHFLRQLPAPLLTNELLDAFYASNSLPTAEVKCQALNLLALQLPAANRAMLRRLLAFLAEVASHQAKNRMSIENVAMIIAPNLIYPPHVRRQKDIHAEITFASVTSEVVKRLIEQRSQLWFVPQEFVRQIRGQHEEEHYERIRKENSKVVKMRILRRRRDTQIVRKIENEVDYQEGIIRVSAVQFNKTSWPFQLTSDTTAADVVSRCVQESMLMPELFRRVHGRRDSRKVDNVRRKDSKVTCSLASADPAALLKGHFLYEEGGNIDCRRIDHAAKMLDCYQENPNSRWVIRCSHGKSP